ncbi:SDR family NAD(P)-dependent oxidoreductase [Chitinophagaceae bacterium 26-R-25]|nr:SDR family NAD(P)-dependent oxidoreductase [Chitinophagaceae bacterium 26-R-25]
MPDRFYTLITGASEGFGKALAIECAKRKMNLILVALPGIELHDLATLIKRDYTVEVIVIEKDLCEENSCYEVFDHVMSLGLCVNMLLNNAGTGSTGSFAAGDIRLFERQIKLNVLASTIIVRLFIDELKQNSPSYILNVGSLASFFPLPKKQVYGATKSFIYYFSTCLRKELKQDQVYVSLICPGPMLTNITVRSVIENGNWLIRNCCFHPEAVAPIAIDGLLKKKKVMVPGKLNNLYILVYTLLPDFIKSIITNRSTKKLNSASFENIALESSLAVNAPQFGHNNDRIDSKNSHF